MNPRWKSQPVQDLTLVAEMPFQYTMDATSAPSYTRNKSLSPKAKYNVAKVVTDKIASEMADLPQGKFCDRMKELENLFESIRMDFPAGILSSKPIGVDDPEDEEKEGTAFWRAVVWFCYGL